MGFASCIEDMTTRFQEMATTAMVGPTSSDLGASISPFPELAKTLKEIGEVAVADSITGDWKQLAHDLDELDQEIRRFDRSTLMQGRAKVLAYAGQLESQMQLLLAKGHSALGLMKHHLENLPAMLRRSKQWYESSNLLITTPASDQDLFHDAVFLLNQYRGLKSELEGLTHRSETLQIELARATLAFCFNCDIGEIPDKDSDS
jgi:hypothetical protein